MFIWYLSPCNEEQKNLWCGLHKPNFNTDKRPSETNSHSVWFHTFYPLALICSFVVDCAVTNQLNVTVHSRKKKHIVKVGGGPVSIATQVSFFASGPFPTCYQMSRSSSSGASKTGSLRAANVRKPNPAGGAGRFQLRRRRRMDRRRDGQTDRQRRCLLITWVLLSFKPSRVPTNLSLCRWNGVKFSLFFSGCP